jgi:hypothetical protein
MIHEQTSDGVISKLVGGEFHTFQNVRVDSNGDVLLTDMQTKRIRKVTKSGIVLTMAGGSMDFD